MGPITPNDCASQSPSYWATVLNKIKLQTGMYRFEDREYLMEPMASTFRRRCYMKGTQGGGSTVEILKSFHGMIYKYLPMGVLYLFPTSDDMHDYSKATMAPLIAANRNAIGRWVKNVKGASDAAALKTVNGANLFMRGAGLSKIIEGEGDASRLKAISVDKVVFDEIELMEKEAIAKAVGRMGNSRVKEEVYIGNPGIPGRGIDEIFSGSNEFRGSDQRHWFRKCNNHGLISSSIKTTIRNHYTCAELDFPGCVKTNSIGKGYIACNECGNQVFVRDGIWVPQRKENSDYLHGWRWSQLTSPNNDPYDILEAYNNPPQGNLADVYRLMLGAPYIATEDQLTTAQVYSRCGPFIMGTKDPGPCAFGLDVGKTKHLVIGKRIGPKNYEIVKIARLSSWDDISEMIMKFNCKSGVVDARPYEDEARRFQTEMKKTGIRVFLCEYSETTPEGTQYNQKTGIVKTNRTEICDATHNLVSRDGLLVLPRQNHPEIKVFAEQVCNPAKVLEVNKKTKQSLYRYRGSDDHYRHALNYFLLAVEKVGRAQRRGHKKKCRKVMNEYARI